MKTITRIFASLSLLLTAAACQQFEVDTQMTPEKEYAGLRLVCDAVDSYAFASTGATPITFNVSANTPWTITRSSGADWCTVTPASSAASGLISDVVVSVADNTTGEDRTATLTVRGERINKTYTITVRQGRKGRLFVTPFANDFAAVGGPLTFTINTNVPWEVRTDVSWLSFNRENGQPDPDGRTITITATAEPSGVMERVATVTVVAGDDEESFEVAQKGAFDLTEISGAFPGAGGTQALKLRTDLPWTVSADKDWISFDREEGVGDGRQTVIDVTAAPNDGAARSAVVTVSAGGVDKSFEVYQSGLAFEIVAPASSELPRQGGEMEIEVNSSLGWEPYSDVDGWTVEKKDNTHFVVKASFNNVFKKKEGKVGIRSGSAVAELELSQDINFQIDGAEVQEDGSVKIIGSKKSRVTTIDGFRYVSFVLEVGDKNFDDAGQFWLCTHDAAGDSELQCQISLNGNKRLRTNGGHTSYGSTPFSIGKDEMNAITEYRVDFRPLDGDPARIKLEFFYNGTSKGVHEIYSGNQLKSPYASDPEASGHYFFGTESGDESSTTWYIVKSCTPTVIEE